MSIEAMKQWLEAEKQDKFCDNNCTWRDHHPDCVRAEKQEPVGFVIDKYNGANTPSLPPTPIVAWLNDNPKIGQVFYTSPPQRQPLTDEQIRELWIENHNKGGATDAFARAIEAAHGIKGEA